MITDTEIRVKGAQVLTQYLGNVEAERFIVLIHREPFDYTKWHQELDENLHGPFPGSAGVPPAQNHDVLFCGQDARAPRDAAPIWPVSDGVWRYFHGKSTNKQRDTSLGNMN